MSLFVTFEGPEGGGKSTQIRRLAAALTATGRQVRQTREPGGTATAEAIRDLLLAGKARSLGAGGEAILFAAARSDHVAKLIRPALERGEWVLCDRFADGDVTQLIRTGDQVTVIPEQGLVRIQRK